MIVHINYDRDGLDIQVPDDAQPTVLRMKPTQPMPDPDAELRRILSHPIAAPALRELAKGRRSACVVMSDITRPVPNRLILPAVLQEIEAGGVPKSEVTILVGTGIHRAATQEELVEMAGPEIVAAYRIVNHDARDPGAHRLVGVTRRGTPAKIDKTYVEADLRVLTGLIEPHLMAGFSGGRKSICPGVASLETVKVWHGPAFIESPRAECGCIEGNAVHEETLEIAKLARVDFIVNAVMNERREVVGLFAGDLVQAHEAGVKRCREIVSAQIEKPFDVVVTTSAGYPLDTTFYQAIKGLTGAMPAVKPGGTIILAAGMTQGIGGPEFTQLCRDMPDLDTFMRKIVHEGYYATDQWQLEELAKAARHADIWVYTDGIAKDRLAELFVTPIDSVEEGIVKALEKHGPGATLAVIPEGPYVLPVAGGQSQG